MRTRFELAKAAFKRQWPFIAHLAALLIVFLNPSVQTYVAQHPTQAFVVGTVWGKLLQWAEPPR